MENENNGNENQDQDTRSEKPEFNMEAYERAKNDMHKYKREASEFKNRFEQLQSELNELKEKGLENKQEYKTLWEREKQSREEIESKYSQFKSNVITDKKRDAVEKFAIKAGLRDTSDLDGFDFDGVELETTSTGKINVIGADSWVETLKSQKPHWFKDSTPADVNNSFGGNRAPDKPKELSARELLDLQKKDPAAYRSYMNNRFKRG